LRRRTNGALLDILPAHLNLAAAEMDRFLKDGRK